MSVARRCIATTDPDPEPGAAARERGGTAGEATVRTPAKTQGAGLRRGRPFAFRAAAFRADAP